MKTHRLWADRGMLLAVLAAGMAAVGSGCSASDAAEPDAGAEAVPVEVAQVQRRVISRQLRYTGDVVGEVEVRVFSIIPDRIIALRVEEGQSVQQGDTIAIIRSTALSQGVQQALGGLGAARAQVDGLRDSLARQRRLLTSGVVTQAQVDATEIQLRSAESQVAQLSATVGSAQSRRSDATVRAPISGVVGQVFVEEGDMAAPQIPICTLVQMDRVEVVFQASERDLGQVRRGMAAEIRTATEPDRVFTAPVSRISPVVDRLSRTATVRIMLDNPDHLLRSGVLADVTIVVERHDNAVVVPQYALVLDDETDERGDAQFNAYVLDGTTARERRVRVGLYEGDDVEILEGLETGERLVVQGQHMLEEGRSVRIARRANGDAGPRRQTAPPTDDGGDRPTSAAAPDEPSEE